jgi:hypothetical protein
MTSKGTDQSRRSAARWRLARQAGDCGRQQMRLLAGKAFSSFIWRRYDTAARAAHKLDGGFCVLIDANQTAISQQQQQRGPNSDPAGGDAQHIKHALTGRSPKHHKRRRQHESATDQTNERDTNFEIESGERFATCSSVRHHRRRRNGRRRQHQHRPAGARSPLIVTILNGKNDKFWIKLIQFKPNG